MFVTVLLIGLCTILLGRIQFGGWFNPLTAYGTVWTVSLTLFQLNLIYYYPLEPETWAVIFAGWVSFVLGCLVVAAARFATRPDASPVPVHASLAEFSPGEIVLLRRMLWVLNTIAVIIAVQHIMTILKKFGSIRDAVLFAQMVYMTRTREGLEGTIPYLGSTMLIGSVLGGIYTSAIGRLKFAAVLPLVTVVAVAIAEMGRMQMLLAIVMFIAGYVLNKRRAAAPERLSIMSARLRRIVAVGLVAVLVAGGAELIRTVRVPYEQFAGTAKALSKLRGGHLITPSIYLYLTVDHGVLNQYLKQDVEHPMMGSFTFAPVWRILAKLGFDTYVPQYQRFYNTPTGSNTATYLRELHADWGLPGVVFGPFLLGLATTVFWYRAVSRHRMVDYVLAAHFFVVVVMSWVDLIIQLGYWLASLGGGLIVAVVYDRLTMKRAAGDPALPPVRAFEGGV